MERKNIFGQIAKKHTGYLESVRKQVAAVDKMIEEENLSINIGQATAGITPYLYATFFEAQDDSDAMFRGLAVMIRTWINIHRAIRKGELLQQYDNGELDDILDDRIKSLLEKDWVLKPDEDLTIIVVNYNEKPIMQIVENQAKGTVVSNLLHERTVPKE